MRMSEVSVENLMEYLREEEESELLSSILSAGKQYVLQFTGLSEEEANEKEDLSLALLAVCADLYDKRGMISSANLNENLLISGILESHRVNFVEGEAKETWSNAEI